MLKLHGFAVSNYYNMVKLALLEKGLPFEEVLFVPNQTPQALAISPRGKVPVLETEHGFLSETTVILDYIEQTQGGKPLLPADADGMCLADASSRPQWLIGVYRTRALRAAASALPDAGRDAPVRALLDDLAIVVVAAPGDLTRDVDTWEDLEEARMRAAQAEESS